MATGATGTQIGRTSKRVAENQRRRKASSQQHQPFVTILTILLLSCHAPTRAHYLCTVCDVAVPWHKNLMIAKTDPPLVEWSRS